MTVIELGDLRTALGGKFCGILIEATRDEIQAIAGQILYKEVTVQTVRKSPEEIWNEKMDKIADALCAVDERIRSDKPSRRYTRDEVLAMLDEIDPSEKDPSEKENESDGK